MSLAGHQRNAVMILGAAAALVVWLGRKRTAEASPPGETLAARNLTISDVGTTIQEDDPADEIVKAVLQEDSLKRLPYSLRYKDGATDLYLRFVRTPEPTWKDYLTNNFLGSNRPLAPSEP